MVQIIQTIFRSKGYRMSHVTVDFNYLLKEKNINTNNKVDRNQPLHVTASLICTETSATVAGLNFGSLTINTFLTTSEAANFLQISKASLLNLSSNGKVPYYKFQRRNRYLRSELLKLLLVTKRGGFHGY